MSGEIYNIYNKLYNFVNFYYYKNLNYFNISPSINKIIDRLYLSDHTVTNDNLLLSNLNINFIVNISTDIPIWHKIDMIKIPINDVQEDEYKFFIKMNYIVDKIHEYYKQNNKNILVHCRAGIQRSATVIACYLLKYHSDIYISYFNEYIKLDQKFQYNEYDVTDFIIKFIQDRRNVAFKPYPHFYNLIRNFFLTYCK